MRADSKIAKRVAQRWLSTKVSYSTEPEAWCQDSGRTGTDLEIAKKVAYAYHSTGFRAAIEKLGRAGGKIRAGHPSIASFQDDLLREGYAVQEGQFIRLTKKGLKIIEPENWMYMTDMAA